MKPSATQGWTVGGWTCVWLLLLGGMLPSRASLPADAPARCPLAGVPTVHRSGTGATVRWQTAHEFGVIGFDLLARAGDRLVATPGSAELILASNSPAGAHYQVDLPAAPADGELWLRIWDETARGTDVPVRPGGAPAAGLSPAQPAPTALPPSARPRAIARHQSEAVQCVAVRTESAGVHFVSLAALGAAFGLPAAEIRERGLSGQLGFRQQGRQVPFWPADDGCHFFAARLDSIHFAGNVTQVRLEPGPTLAARSADAGDDLAAGLAESTLEWETNAQAVPTLPGAAEDDFWIWDPLLGGHPTLGERTYPCDLGGFAAGAGSASVAVTLISASEAAHSVRVSLNGREIGTERWSGRGRRTLRFPVPAGDWNAGPNSLRLTSLGDRLSLVYVDHLAITAPRNLAPQSGPIGFSVSRPGWLESAADADHEVEVWDTTDPWSPVRLRSAHPGAFRFVGLAGHAYVTFVRGAALPVGPLTVFGADPLRDPGSGADYLIVTTEALHEAALELAAWREAGGLSARVVTIESVVQEFGAGVTSPTALAAFLGHTRTNWNPAPHYVVLAGDGTYDYRNFLGAGDNLVPPFVAATEFGRIVTDGPFASGNEDGQPVLALGRLPVRTAGELRQLVDRIRAFESRPQVRPKALLLADRPDDGGAFGDQVADLAARLAGAFAVETLLGEGLELTEMRSRLAGELAAGVNLFNYVGHGGRDRLGDGYLTVEDVAGLDFGPDQPVVAAMTCAAGQFGLPGTASLSEALLLRSTPGPIAVWSPSGFSLSFQAQRLNELFALELSRQPARTRLGDTVRRALATYVHEGGDRTTPALYNLLGDPALALNFGAPPLALKLTAGVTGVHGIISGPAGTACVLEAAERAPGGPWEPIRELYLGANGETDFFEAVNADPGHRFFRVRTKP